MSRAFIKEIDEKPEEVLARPVSAQPNYVTPSGLKQIELALAKYEAGSQGPSEADALMLEGHSWRAI